MAIWGPRCAAAAILCRILPSKNFPKILEFSKSTRFWMLALENFESTVFHTIHIFKLNVRTGLTPAKNTLNNKLGRFFLENSFDNIFRMCKTCPKMHSPASKTKKRQQYRNSAIFECTVNGDSVKRARIQSDGTVKTGISGKRRWRPPGQDFRKHWRHYNVFFLCLNCTTLTFCSSMVLRRT